MEFPAPISPRYSTRPPRAKLLLGATVEAVPPPTGKHVLIVDDDPNFRSLFRVMLGQTGFPVASVREAADSLTGVAFCREAWQGDELDVVFCDLNLSVIRPRHGIGTVRDIRRMRPYLPVYMITADNDSEVVEKIVEAGATGHILKPLNLRILRRVLMATFPFDAGSL